MASGGGLPKDHQDPVTGEGKCGIGLASSRGHIMTNAQRQAKRLLDGGDTVVDQASALLKAMANDNRLRILCLLAGAELSVTELNQRLASVSPPCLNTSPYFAGRNWSRPGAPPRRSTIPCRASAPIRSSRHSAS